jgi:urea transporter
MKKPLHPWIVLAIAAALPGVGQVVNRQPLRGLIFLFFTILLGAFTLKTAAADVSIVGKYAGGLFVWAVSILDAYKIARIRFEVWRHASPSPAGN